MRNISVKLFLIWTSRSISLNAFIAIKQGIRPQVFSTFVTALSLKQIGAYKNVHSWSISMSSSTSSWRDMISMFQILALVAIFEMGAVPFVQFG